MALEVPLSTSAVTSHCLPGVISRKHALQKPQQDSLYTILVLNLYEFSGNRANGYQGVRALGPSPPPPHPPIRLYFYNHAVKHILVFKSCLQCVNFICYSKVTTLASKHSFVQLTKQHHAQLGSAFCHMSLGTQVTGTRQERLPYLAIPMLQTNSIQCLMVCF